MNVSTSTSASQIRAYQRVIDPGATKPAAHPSGQTKEQARLEGLMNAWGSDQAAYDVDGNGVVDVDDLLQFINALSAPKDSAPTADVPIDTQAIAGEEPVTMDDASAAPGADASPMDGLLAAWGESESVYDLDKNGTVDTDDLLAFINGMSNPKSAEIAQTAKPVDALQPIAVSPSAEKTSDVKALSDLMIRRLAASGFDRQPPINLRELVDRLDLSPRDSKTMFERLRARYPQGLGVNLVG